jgi:hypothetical protein
MSEVKSSAPIRTILRERSERASERAGGRREAARTSVWRKRARADRNREGSNEEEYEAKKTKKEDRD